MYQDDDAEVSAHLRLFAEQTRDFVAVADAWGRVVYLNPAARKRLGVTEAAEISITEVFPAEEFALYYEVARPQLLRTGAWSGEIRVNIAGEGAVPMYVSTSATVGPGGAINGLVVHAREVPRADPSAASEGLEIDEATGLLASPAFDHRVRLALAAAERGDDMCALVLVAIVGMSATVEAIGQAAAVTVERSLAGRLTRFARTIDVVGRAGPHRIALLLRSVRTHREALRIAEALRESLVDLPITTAGGDVAVFVTCGVAFSRAGDDAAAFMERAAEAVAYAERDGEIAARAVVDGGSEPLITIEDFRLAFSNRTLRAYAQPIVDLRSGLAVAYRGFARWQHPRLGLLDADVFADMIAATPLANQVDLYVARELAQVITLSVRDQPLSLYTPMSKRSIVDVHTELYLSEIADAYFLSLSQMRLQVARELLVDCPPPLRDAMSSLADTGPALVLTGVESASDFVDLVALFREVHLAPRLAHAAASDAGARLEIAEIVRKAHDRDVRVTAAGVDTVQARDPLIDAGCDLAYGDLFAAPERAEDIE